MIKKALNFLKNDLWSTDLGQLSKLQRYSIKKARTIMLAIRGFKEDDCLMRASALTYYSVLSIVPVFAMIFGVAKGFGLEDKLNTILKSQLGGQQEVLENVMSFSHNLLENTKGGLVAGVGVVLLLWSVIKVMGNIEISFNAIWGIRTQRSFIRKFTEYLAFVVLAPILVILASSATIFIAAYVKELGGIMGLAQWFDEGVSLFLRILPYFIMTLLFTLLYTIMPNTKVQFKYAIPAAVIAGTGFQLLEWGYFNFQIFAVKYNAIYGSFAALPLFLVWMQASWMIVLFGSELAFANQNQGQYEFEAEVENASPMYKKKSALLVSHHIVNQFVNGCIPPTLDDLCNTLQLPFRLVSANVFELQKSNIISEVHRENYIGFQPAVSVDKLSIQYVLEALEKSGEHNLPIPKGNAFLTIDNSVNEFYSKLNDLPGNILLRDLKN